MYVPGGLVSAANSDRVVCRGRTVTELSGDLHRLNHYIGANNGSCCSGHGGRALLSLSDPLREASVVSRSVIVCPASTERVKLSVSPSVPIIPDWVGS